MLTDPIQTLKTKLIAIKTSNKINPLICSADGISDSVDWAGLLIFANMPYFQRVATPKIGNSLAVIVRNAGYCAQAWMISLKSPSCA
ncbi:MAG: hypothetical protein A2X74_04440 [Polynucleobacter sp. GWA2_45_21]|nr:MAG: hypothetical protein A2X74_04440 [Polynucleobacter sp. GWA2_45_21]HBK43812.1 hypothetical protein [Polynucleobacter sp.]